MNYLLPEVPGLICATDFLNAWFPNNPTKMKVKSYHGAMQKYRPKDIYSADLKLVIKTSVFTIGAFPSSIEKRTYSMWAMVTAWDSKAARMWSIPET